MNWSRFSLRCASGCVLCLLLCLLETAHSQQYSKLRFQSGKDTIVNGYRLRLQEPDDPDAPHLWQGPLSIVGESGSCTINASLIRDVFLSSTAKLAVVTSISGSTTYVGFFNPRTCARKWPTLTAFTEGVSIDGDRLKLRPACEAAGNAYSCSAASVYRLRDNVRPAKLLAGSREFTRQTLGIGFIGERTLEHIPASLAPLR